MSLISAAMRSPEGCEASFMGRENGEDADPETCGFRRTFSSRHSTDGGWANAHAFGRIASDNRA
jgi:hypothetical protein